LLAENLLVVFACSGNLILINIYRCLQLKYAFEKVGVRTHRRRSFSSWPTVFVEETDTALKRQLELRAPIVMPSEHFRQMDAGVLSVSFA
jgi:hypothetical protein